MLKGSDSNLVLEYVFELIIYVMPMQKGKYYQKCQSGLYPFKLSLNIENVNHNEIKEFNIFPYFVSCI